jgi:N-hydroxyarylamine O-acetyltransferase
VPFENLSIHLAEQVSLDERDLIDKIVRRRRGGFCYELNGAFALLLEALGAQVSRVAARVYGESGLGPPTWASAVTATTRCCWRLGTSNTSRPAGSGSPTPAQETSTC